MNFAHFTKSEMAGGQNAPTIAARRGPAKSA